MLFRMTSLSIDTKRASWQSQAITLEWEGYLTNTTVLIFGQIPEG